METPDSMIVDAVKDMKDRSSDLKEALRLAMARSNRLATTRTMEVGGCLSLAPSISEPKPAPKPMTVKIENSCAPCCSRPQDSDSTADKAEEVKLEED